MTGQCQLLEYNFCWYVGIRRKNTINVTNWLMSKIFNRWLFWSLKEGHFKNRCKKVSFMSFYSKSTAAKYLWCLSVRLSPNLYLVFFQREREIVFTVENEI